MPPAPRTRLRTIARRWRRSCSWSFSPAASCRLLRRLMPARTYSSLPLVLALRRSSSSASRASSVAVVRYRGPAATTSCGALHFTTRRSHWTTQPTGIVFVLFFSASHPGRGGASSTSPTRDRRSPRFPWQWTFRTERRRDHGPPISRPCRRCRDSRCVLVCSARREPPFYVPDFLIKRDVIDFATHDRRTS